MKQSISLELGPFAARTLAGCDEGGAEDVPARIARALHYYLSDRGSGRPGWPYPELLRGEPVGEGVSQEVELDASVWTAFRSEAERQGVSARRLAEHAVLYYSADRDAGRVTQRILDDLGEG